MTLVRSRLTHSPLVYGGGARKLALPASFVLNGTDELLTRTVSTSSPNTTTATISMWHKSAVGTGSQYFLTSYFSSTDYSRFLAQSDESLLAHGADGISNLWTELTAAGVLSVDDTWHHYVFRYDSTQGTADNRIRIYKDGSLITDNPVLGGEPGASEDIRMFMDGKTMDVGNLAGGPFIAKKLAFIDVLEGVSAAPTDFAFDNGGTWTRKPYVGSYGTYGFELDGTNSFNDVSGNGQNFTGTNMDASNLDTADLPPYTA